MDWAIVKYWPEILYACRLCTDCLLPDPADDTCSFFIISCSFADARVSADVKTDIWTALLEPYSISASAQGPVSNLLFEASKMTDLTLQIWSPEMLNLNLRQSDLFVLLPTALQLIEKYKKTVGLFLMLLFPPASLVN